MSDKPDQESMTRYLLGDLPEEEQQRLEQKFMADDDCFEDLLALEDELRYDYARGALTSEEREGYEGRFLRSRADRDRLEAAEAVLQGIAARQSRPSKTWSIWDSLRLSRPLGLSVAAASLLFLATSAWLLMETLRLRGRLEEAASSQAARIEALRKEALDERGRADRLREELENERGRQARAQSPLSPSFISLALTPGLARESGTSPQRLAIPPGTDLIRAELTLRSRSEYAVYRATLRTADGSEVLRLDDLRAAGRTIRLSIPARLLREGDYELVLEGRTPQRSPEEAGDYYFTVISSPR